VGSGPLESAVQATIVELARMCGWRVYHTFDSRKSEPGFPDIVLVRERVVYAEIKRIGERPRPSQVDWLNALVGAGAEVYVWTIADIEDAKAVLLRRQPPISSHLVPDTDRGAA